MQLRRKIKRLAALVLAISMALGCMPVGAWAEATTPTDLPTIIATDGEAVPEPTLPSDEQEAEQTDEEPTPEIRKCPMNPMATAIPLRMTLLPNRENPQMTTLTTRLPTIRREMMHRMRSPMILWTYRKKMRTMPLIRKLNLTTGSRFRRLLTNTVMSTSPPSTRLPYITTLR